MWPDLVASAKTGGADAIETYVFWNGHELSPGNYPFEDRFDLVKFVNVVKDARMYLILRIGPFIAAEWNFGGIPAWLHYIPGVIFRSNNEQFKSHMQSFMTYIVDMMKREKLFAPQGCPIILAQVENEYGHVESAQTEGGNNAVSVLQSLRNLHENPSSFNIVVSLEVQNSLNTLPNLMLRRYVEEDGGEWMIVGDV